MTKDELIFEYGDELRRMTHAAYAKLVVAVCPASPARESAIELDKSDVNRRVTNICRGKVLAALHRRRMGQPVAMASSSAAPQQSGCLSGQQREPGDEIDSDGLDLP